MGSSQPACDHCGSRDVWQPHVRGVVDGILERAGVERFECRRCRRPILLRTRQGILSMRRSAEHFGDRELILVYIARRLKEALALEALLTDCGVDYLVEADKYRGGVIFQTERIGAFFYVSPEAATSTRNLLLLHGYKPYEALG